jgi:FkbM family methyltransferase
MSVGRVARLVSEKYPGEVFVDIGANVGDTAAIIRSFGTKNRLICIEGVDFFFRLLERNVESIGAVTPVKAFVSTHSASGDGRLRVLSSGNAVVFDEPGLYPESSSADSVDLQFHTLAALLDGRLNGANVKLLKTDIEGFDMPVLNANLEIVSAHLPVIFFEMHVSDVDERARKVGWREFFSNMRKLGYSSAFYWTCSREYLCHVPLSCWDTIEDLNEHFRNRHGLLYADVCLVHGTDSDLAEKIRTGELAHDRTLRPPFP